MKSKTPDTQIAEDAIEFLENQMQETFEEIKRLAYVGRRVTWVVRRNGKKYRHFGRIIQNGWYRNPDEIVVKNEKTGKTRRISIGEYWRVDLL